MTNNSVTPQTTRREMMRTSSLLAAGLLLTGSLPSGHRPEARAADPGDTQQPPPQPPVADAPAQEAPGFVSRTWSGPKATEIKDRSSATNVVAYSAAGVGASGELVRSIILGGKHSDLTTWNHELMEARRPGQSRFKWCMINASPRSVRCLAEEGTRALGAAYLCDSPAGIAVFLVASTVLYGWSRVYRFKGTPKTGEDRPRMELTLRSPLKSFQELRHRFARFRARHTKDGVPLEDFAVGATQGAVTMFFGLTGAILSRCALRLGRETALALRYPSETF